MLGLGVGPLAMSCVCWEWSRYVRILLVTWCIVELQAVTWCRPVCML